MLPNVSCYHLAMLRCSIIQNPLDKIVAILIAGNVNQGNPSSVTATFTDTVKVATKELGSSNLQTLLNDFRGELISAVLGCVANHMINGSASVRRSAVLTNVLNAPVPKLTMSHNVNVGEYFLDARSLEREH